MLTQPKTLYEFKPGDVVRILPNDMCVVNRSPYFKAGDLAKLIAQAASKWWIADFSGFENQEFYDDGVWGVGQAEDGGLAMELVERGGERVAPVEEERC